MNSVIYHQTVTFVNQNEAIKRALGQHLQIMNCNGKIHPLKSIVDFDLVIFGSSQKGKLHVKTEYKKQDHQYNINSIELFTKKERI